MFIRQSSSDLFLSCVRPCSSVFFLPSFHRLFLHLFNPYVFSVIFHWTRFLGLFLHHCAHLPFSPCVRLSVSPSVFLLNLDLSVFLNLSPSAGLSLFPWVSVFLRLSFSALLLVFLSARLRLSLTVFHFMSFFLFVFLHGCLSLRLPTYPSFFLRCLSPQSFNLSFSFSRSYPSFSLLLSFSSPTHVHYHPSLFLPLTPPPLLPVIISLFFAMYLPISLGLLVSLPLFHRLVSVSQSRSLFLPGLNRSPSGFLSPFLPLLVCVSRSLPASPPNTHTRTHFSTSIRELSESGNITLTIQN